MNPLCRKKENASFCQPKWLIICVHHDKSFVKSRQSLACGVAARESYEVMEKEVARLEQLNRDVKGTCQQLQATVDDLSR